MKNKLPRGRMKRTDKVKGVDCPIPDEPGIYRHINKTTKSIDYVGQSSQVRTRQQQHQRNGKLNTKTHWIDFTTFIDLGKDALRRIEKAHIKRHKPSKNICRGGNGR